MSYDLRIGVKVEDLDFIAVIARPEYDSPTYNLRDMFVNCMKWDYEQGEWYRCDKVIDKIEHGIRELRTNRKKYVKYNPSNGWGNIDSALRSLESLRTCIYEEAENIPIKHLYMRW